MEVTADHKNEIETKIVETIIAALDENKLADEELPKIANFVLGRIDAVSNHTEMVQFLSELSSQWPIFTNIEAIEKGEVKKQKEDEVAEDVLEFAKSGKIDEAISLAKTMTGK